mgnify:CR=1 FL=1
MARKSGLNGRQSGLESKKSIQRNQSGLGSPSNERNQSSLMRNLEEDQRQVLNKEIGGSYTVGAN